MKTRLHRWLGAAAIGGGLFFLWTGSANAEPNIDISGRTIDVDDVLAAPEPTIDATLPVGAEALLGTNDVVAGDRDAPVAAEVVTDDLPDPTVVTPPAEAEATVADSTADVVAPVATVDPDVVVCGNAGGVIGDAAADCDPAPDDGTTGTTAEPGGAFAVDLGDGTTVAGDLPEVVADPDVLVCGNAVGIVGDADAGCGPDGDATPVADAGSLDLVLGGATPVSGTTLDGGLPGVVADPDAVVCGNGVGVIGDAGGNCAPAASGTPVAEAGSLDLLLGGTTPVSGSTLTGETPGVVAAPDAMACGNGAGIVGDGSGTCAPTGTEEPLTPVETAGLDLALGGTTPLEGSEAVVDASTTGIDPNAAVCGNGAGIVGDGSGTCGTTGSPVPALPVDPTGAVEVLLPALPDEPEAPGTPPLPIDPFGGLGEITPVEPAPSPSPAPTPDPTRPGLGTSGPLTPIGSGVGGFGSLAPLGTASGTGAAADLAALGTSAADLAAGTGAAALAFTGFGIRNALNLALVLLALGALLLAGRRRVELMLTVS